jgi:hypothetical protein
LKNAEDLNIRTIVVGYGRTHPVFDRKILAGDITDAQIKGLQSLLAIYPDLFLLVKDFLTTYHDYEPQVTPKEIHAFFKQVNHSHLSE